MSTPQRVESVGYPCPACGSETPFGQLELRDGRIRYTGCLRCGALWESLPSGETFLVDGELMPWSEPCDNCAFRPGSPESENRTEWKKLLETLRRGGQFFCHKGVPLDLDERGKPRGKGFHYPHDETGEFDRHRNRLCRGFLNAWSVWVKRESRRLSFTCTTADLDAGET